MTGGARERGADAASRSRRAVEAIWRIESAKIVATLTRYTGDLGLAEDLAQDALADAMVQWADTGIPSSPGAWLTTVAKRKAIDGWRRRERRDDGYEAIGRDLESRLDLDAQPWDPDRIDDDVLRLLFIACHPVLTREAQIALTLRIVGGLSSEEIARAFMLPVATIQQRIVRAKRTLGAAHAEFEVPPREEYPQRLAAVLNVIYLIYNEGYAATAGEDWMRPHLASEALRLGRVLAGLVPKEPEVHGLVALMELQSSRFAARTTTAGEPILLMDQDRSRWDHAQIARGRAALGRADALRRGRGAYALQAAIAECHAIARTGEQTDWDRIVLLYEALGALAPSPVVELGRAAAVSMATGPASALLIVDALERDGALAGYHLLPSVRGELLARLGRHKEAAVEFDAAAGLTGNVRERAVLLDKARGSRSSA
jgi:RNA polymerase sigma factor (sigma-70 family)